MDIVLQAKSSSKPEPYFVVFAFDGGKLKVHCDCPAGELGQLCKHKLTLLLGDASMLYATNQSKPFADVTQKVLSTSIPSLIAELQATEKETEQTIAQAKRRLTSAKQKLARLLNEGVR
jgi:uncharacterized Zn finger protein